ncbi:MAG: hypothetical protein KBS70_05200, partial [Bacteroidales bacterium]|nr:hypothetical protein [Candidatus Colicola equi]
MAATKEITEWAKAASVEDLVQNISILKIEDVFDTPMLCEIGSADKQNGFVRAVIDNLYRNYGRSCPEVDGKIFSTRFIQTYCNYTLGDLIHFVDKCTEEYEIEYLNPAAIWKHWRLYIQYRGKEQTRMMESSAKATRAQADKVEYPTPEEVEVYVKRIKERLAEGHNWLRDYNAKGPDELPMLRWCQIVTYDKYLAYMHSQSGWEKEPATGNWMQINEDRQKYWQHFWKVKVIQPAVARYQAAMSNNQ